MLWPPVHNATKSLCAKKRRRETRRDLRRIALHRVVAVEATAVSTGRDCGSGVPYGRLIVLRGVVNTAVVIAVANIEDGDC